MVSENGKRASAWLGFVVYFGMMTLFLHEWGWQLVWWWLGGLMGMSLIWIDRFVYAYLTRPQDQLSVYVRYLVKQMRYGQVLKILTVRGDEQLHLITQSFLFMAVWVAVAVYVVSSSGSLLAAGLVLGMGWRSVWEIGVNWRDMEQLRRQLFWQVKRHLSDREIKVTLGLYLVVFGLLSLAML